jgi:hypothetical protein
MSIALEYLILCLALVWEVITDYIRIKVDGKEDNHKADLLPRFLFCVASGLLLHFIYDNPFLPGLIYSGCIFIALFDVIMGLLLQGNPLYLGKTSKTDLILANTPPHGQILVRLWVLGVGIGCYYYWDLVIGR